MTYWNDLLTEVDRWRFDEWAYQMLTRPSDFGGPEQMYTTHAPVFSLAVNGDDLLAESNSHAFEQEMYGVTGWISDEEREQAEREEWYFLGRARHWAVGPLDQIIVRMYTGDGTPTPHALRAYQLHQALEDYPVLDDEDYSRREWEAYNTDFEEGARHKAWTHDDGDHEEGILAEAYKLQSDLPYWEQDRAYGDGEDLYEEARDTYYTALGEAYLQAERDAERACYEHDLIDLAGM